MTEWLHFHFPISHVGEGNGNPLQCSCLENPRDGGAWWAAVYGVAQSRTRLKWLSSSSSSMEGRQSGGDDIWRACWAGGQSQFLNGSCESVAGRRLLPGLESGLLSNTQKWIVRGDTCSEKARDFIRKGSLGGEQQGNRTQEDCSVMWLAASGFTVMGLVSRLSLANHSDSGYFLVVHVLLSQDGCQWKGFWEMVGHVHLLLTFPELFWLVVAS